jgi:hypothetical protein
MEALYDLPILHWAAMSSSNANQLQLVLQTPCICDLRKRDLNRCTPIECFIHRDSFPEKFAMVEMLARADCPSSSTLGNLINDICSKFEVNIDDIKIFDLLVSLNPNAVKQKTQGCLPLHSLCKSSRSVPLLAKLLAIYKEGAEFRDDEGRLPLELALPFYCRRGPFSLAIDMRNSKNKVFEVENHDKFVTLLIEAY